MNIVHPCPRQRGKTIVGTALAAVVGLTAPAVGQFGEAAGFADSMQPDLFSRDLVVFSEVLELDESQRLIVEALFTDHQEDFQLGLENMRNRFDEMRDDFTGNDVKRIMTLVFLPFQEWRGEKEILRQEFMENVKVVLTEEQHVLAREYGFKSWDWLQAVVEVDFDVLALLYRRRSAHPVQRDRPTRPDRRTP